MQNWRYSLTQHSQAQSACTSRLHTCRSKTRNAFRHRHWKPQPQAVILMVGKAPTASQTFQTSKKIDDRLDMQCQLLLRDCCKAARAIHVVITTTVTKPRSLSNKLHRRWSLVQLGTGSRNVHNRGNEGSPESMHLLHQQPQLLCAA